MNVLYGMMDTGIFMAGVCLIAQNKGLGALILSTVVRYRDLAHTLLGITANKRVVMGIALGYADATVPINRFERERTPMEEFTTWIS